MKVLIFLSRVAFICNLFFVACVILRYVELSRVGKPDKSGVLHSQWITSTIVVLGYSAIFLNAILFIAYLWALITGKARGKGLALWLMLTNIIFFGIQVYYFFFL